jgi:hypothetical protein
MANNSDKAGEFRKLAEGARADAEKMLDRHMKQTLLQVAAAYDLLATRLEATTSRLREKEAN